MKILGCCRLAVLGLALATSVVAYGQAAFKWQVQLPFAAYASGQPSSKYTTFTFKPDGTTFIAKAFSDTTFPVLRITPTGQMTTFATISPRAYGGTSSVLTGGGKVWVWWTEHDGRVPLVKGSAYFACFSEDGFPLWQSQGSLFESALIWHWPVAVTDEGDLIAYATQRSTSIATPTRIAVMNSAGVVDINTIAASGQHIVQSLGPDGLLYGYEKPGGYTNNVFCATPTSIVWKTPSLSLAYAVMADSSSNAFSAAVHHAGIRFEKFDSTGAMVWSTTDVDPWFKDGEPGMTWSGGGLPYDLVVDPSGSMKVAGNYAKSWPNNTWFPTWYATYLWRAPSATGIIERTEIYYESVSDIAGDSTGAEYLLLLKREPLDDGAPVIWKIMKRSSGALEWTVAPPEFFPSEGPKGDRVNVSPLNGNVRVVIGDRLFCFEQMAQPKPDNYNGGGSGILLSPWSVLGNDTFGWSGYPVITKWPAKGALFMRGTGRYFYSPWPSGSNSQDTFEYAVKNLAGQSVSTTVKVNVPPVAPGRVTGLALTAAKVTGGDPVVGTVSFSEPASVSGMQVGLWTSSWLLTTIPETKTIALGKDTTKFPITTVPVASDTTVNITAIRYGARAVQPLLILSPRLREVKAPSGTLASGTSMKGVVILKGRAAKGGVVVALKTNNKDILAVPATVTVPEGKASTVFTVKAKSAAASTNVVVTATVLESVRRMTVTVTP